MLSPQVTELYIMWSNVIGTTMSLKSGSVCLWCLKASEKLGLGRAHQLVQYVYMLTKECNNYTSYLSSHILSDPSTASFHYLLIYLHKNRNPAMIHSTSKTCCYDVQKRHPEADSHLWRSEVQGSIKAYFVCSCKHDSNTHLLIYLPCSNRRGCYRRDQCSICTSTGCYLILYVILTGDNSSWKGALGRLSSNLPLKVDSAMRSDQVTQGLSSQALKIPKNRVHHLADVLVV